MKLTKESQTEELNNTPSSQPQDLSKAKDKPNSSSEIFTKEVVENSPFVIITKDDESCVVMGNKRLTEAMTKEECREWCKPNWNNIVTVIQIMIDDQELIKKYMKDHE